MAGVKISALPGVATPALTDIFPEVQSGVTYQATLQQVYTLFFGAASPTANTIPYANGTSSFSYLGPLTNGQLIIGSTGAAPVAASLTAGTNISITPGAGSISIAASGAAAFTWVDAPGPAGSLSVNEGVIIDNGGSLVTLSLPATSVQGDVVRVGGFSSNGWKVTQAAGQQIHVGNVDTTLGATGFIASTNRHDCIELLCVTANTEWIALSVVGNITVS